MGAYLSQPVTDKELYEGAGEKLVFGGASMQGWRRTMEDAHVAAIALGNESDAAMFGVFDGHGGSEVAKFCQKYMAQEVTKLKQYQEGNVTESLVEVFHRMDNMLKEPTYAQEIEALRGAGEGEEDEPDVEAENGQVSTSEALEMLKKIMALKRLMNEGRAEDESGGESDRMQEDELPEHKVQAGCTAVVALLRGRDVYVANAGDSRAVLCRGREAVALSQDHKPAQETERTRIMAAGGFLSDVGGVTRVNGNLNLSRAIGDLKYKGNQQLPPKDQIITAEPEIQHITLTPEDRFIVLACDGVWDVMSNQEVVDFVADRMDKDLKPSQIASELLDNCLASDPKETRGIGCDNMTCTIVRLL